MRELGERTPIPLADALDYLELLAAQRYLLNFESVGRARGTAAAIVAGGFALGAICLIAVVAAFGVGPIVRRSLVAMATEKQRRDGGEVVLDSELLANVARELDELPRQGERWQDFIRRVFPLRGVPLSDLDAATVARLFPS